MTFSTKAVLSDTETYKQQRICTDFVAVYILDWMYLLENILLAGNSIQFVGSRNFLLAFAPLVKSPVLYTTGDSIGIVVQYYIVGFP